MTYEGVNPLSGRIRGHVRNFELLSTLDEPAEKSQANMSHFNHTQNLGPPFGEGSGCPAYAEDSKV